jgi:hypothetical protein
MNNNNGAEPGLQSHDSTTKRDVTPSTPFQLPSPPASADHSLFAASLPHLPHRKMREA